MNTANVTSSLNILLTELVDGTAPTGGYMLNRGDTGLLRALDSLTAAEASQIIDGGSSIAAHVDHVSYYFSLMNRWANGEKPWKTADWAASWRRTAVTDETWVELRRSFTQEVRNWQAVVKEPRDVETVELTGMIASIVHLAYHVGAMRQMNRALSGPSAQNEQDAFTTS
jgi:hypothetical protein